MERAAGLFGASQAVREAIGAPVPRPDMVRFNAAVAATVRALGGGRFAAARQAGRALSVAQAVEFAKSDAPSPDRFPSSPTPA